MKGNNKAFTIIELVVVVAVIGILTLLATPKVIGNTEKAQLARIQNDVRALENIVETEFAFNDNLYNQWEDASKDLEYIVLEDNLYGRDGIAFTVEKPLNYKINKIDVKKAKAGGYKVIVDEDKRAQNYKRIPDEFVSKVKTKLKGVFYTNEDGRVYYEHTKDISKKDKDRRLVSSAEDAYLDYEFDYVTGTITKFKNPNNKTEVVIPSLLNVNGISYPVSIIGSKAFEGQGITKLTLPNSLEEIKDESFANNELTELKIPWSVRRINKNSFDGNNFKKGTYQYVGSAIDLNGGSKVLPTTNKDNTEIEISYQPPSATAAGLVFDKKTGTLLGVTGMGADGMKGYSDKLILNVPPVVVDETNNSKFYVIEHIARGAFQGENFKHVILPSSVKTIDDYAFAGNQIETVKIPHTVAYIGNYAFAFNEKHIANSSGKIVKTENSIKSISIQNKEWIGTLNQNGDIVENGGKVDLMEYNQETYPPTLLKNQIWVTGSLANLKEPDWTIESITKEELLEELSKKIDEFVKLKEEDFSEADWAHLVNLVTEAKRLEKSGSSTLQELKDILKELSNIN